MLRETQYIVELMAASNRQKGAVTADVASLVVEHIETVDLALAILAQRVLTYTGEHTKETIIGDALQTAHGLLKAQKAEQAAKEAADEEQNRVRDRWLIEDSEGEAVDEPDTVVSVEAELAACEEKIPF